MYAMTMLRMLPATMLSLLMLGLPACGGAQQGQPMVMDSRTVPESDGPCTWIRNGAGFAARFKRDQYVENSTDTLCQRMGNLYIGMPENEARRFLPGQSEVVPNAPGGGVTFHHRLAPEGPDAYVKFDEGKLSTLQVSGDTADRSLNFHSVYLGMSEADLARRFGPPLQRYPALDGAVLWAYRPWPFSFLVRQGRVVSIRFYRGGDDSPGR